MEKAAGWEKLPGDQEPQLTSELTFRTSRYHIINQVIKSHGASGGAVCDSAGGDAGREFPGRA